MQAEASVNEGPSASQKHLGNIFLEKKKCNADLKKFYQNFSKYDLKVDKHIHNDLDLELDAKIMWKY